MPRRQPKSIAAEAKFRQRLAELGAELLEPYRTSGVPHRVRCAAGHDCQPRPSDVIAGQGICCTCANKDPAIAGVAFRAALAEIGATLLEPYKGAGFAHHVRCAEGHDCKGRWTNLQKGLGICRTCAGQDPDVAAAAFQRVLREAGAILLDPYKNAHTRCQVLCAAGHLSSPLPMNVVRGNGFCRDCAYKSWDVFYVVTHESEPRVKFGITGRGGRVRLRDHRRYGYTTVLRLATGLPGHLARDTEDAVRSALTMAGQKPVKGREYFDISSLGLILDVADSWLASRPGGTVPAGP